MCLVVVVSGPEGEGSVSPKQEGNGVLSRKFPCSCPSQRLDPVDSGCLRDRQSNDDK